MMTELSLTFCSNSPNVCAKYAKLISVAIATVIANPTIEKMMPVLFCRGTLFTAARFSLTEEVMRPSKAFIISTISRRVELPSLGISTSPLGRAAWCSPLTLLGVIMSPFTLYVRHLLLLARPELHHLLLDSVAVHHVAV